jgi:hypothetical protein
MLERVEVRAVLLVFGDCRRASPGDRDVSPDASAREKERERGERGERERERERERKRERKRERQRGRERERVSILACLTGLLLGVG